MSAPTVTVGQVVHYVADACHALDLDAKNERVFAFEHVADAPNSATRYRKGDRVADFNALGHLQRRDGDSIVTAGGHKIRPVAPKTSWRAVVREVFADGSLALDVVHPLGGITLHCPGHGKTGPGVPYDASGATLNSWHLAE